jgi:hypothetical protein
LTSAGRPARVREGRQCAREVDQFLMGESVLPR